MTAAACAPARRGRRILRACETRRPERAAGSREEDSLSDLDRRKLSYVLWSVGLAIVVFSGLLIVVWHQRGWPLLLSMLGLVVALISRRMRGRSALGIIERLQKRPRE